MDIITLEIGLKQQQEKQGSKAWLNEELKILNAEAKELESIIADNIQKLLA